MFLVAIAGWFLRRRAVTRFVATWEAGLLAAMMLTAVTGWPTSGAPGIVAAAGVVGWAFVLAVASIGIGRITRAPALAAATRLTVAAFTVDAALGSPMQPGSLL